MKTKFLRQKTALTLFLASMIVSASPATEPDPLIVKTESGAVQGAATEDVISWKGIPFAEPPVGELRWRNPRPAKPWEGVRRAIEFGASPIQGASITQSEDCLTLNIWRPANPAMRSLPVLVWIYGAGLTRGTALVYPADALAARGIVVVTFNYRLGRLGFFAHPALAAEAPDEVRGNYGYMDQLAALKWVRKNIAAFGGDPEKVTLCGESAGGGSVLAHLVSPLSRGLFQRAILQSPGLPGPRAQVLPATSLADAEQTALDYARSLGINREGADALRALRLIPVDKINAGLPTSMEAAVSVSYGKRPLGSAGAIVDGRFLTEVPETAIVGGRLARVPVIVGANDRDLGLELVASKADLWALFGDHAEEGRMLYDPAGKETLVDLKRQATGDKTMVEPSRHLADELARAGSPVWWYRFSYVAEGLRDDPFFGKGAYHALEIPFVFNNPSLLMPFATAISSTKVAATDADRGMANLMSGYWVTFATAGDPNGEGRPLWPHHETGVDRVLNFTNNGAVVGPDPLKPRLDLWVQVWGVKPPESGAPTE